MATTTLPPARVRFGIRAGRPVVPRGLAGFASQDREFQRALAADPTMRRELIAALARRRWFGRVGDLAETAAVRHRHRQSAA